MRQLAAYLQKGYTKDQLSTTLDTLKSVEYLHPAVHRDASELEVILFILAVNIDAIMKHARDKTHAFILYYRFNQELYADKANSEDLLEAAKNFFSQMPSEDPHIVQHLLMGDI